MARLYPPNIEGTIPAFYKEGTSCYIEVPFSMNRAVSISEVSDMKLKIRAVNTDKELYVVSVRKKDDGTTPYFTSVRAYFTIEDTEEKLVPGQYYRIQLAYVSNTASKTVGYYSSIGVIKCTTKPRVYIENLDSAMMNSHVYSYIGVYSLSTEEGITSTMDTSEKLASYRFTLLDGDGNTIADSDELLHSNYNDVYPYEATETYVIPLDLDPQLKYFLTFSIETTNGLKLTSPKYKIVLALSVDSVLEVDFVATVNEESGGVILNLVAKNNDVITGDFLLSRAASNDNWGWNKLKYFNLWSEKPTKTLMIDLTVEQGVYYKYSILQYNSYGVYSNRIVSNLVWVDFEDSFLYDGEKLLKVKFNPKVSSFKNNIQETKVDTIGSKYPFIMRNGHVKYKEFPISGLISYQMDDTDSFRSDNLKMVGYRTSTPSADTYNNSHLDGFWTLNDLTGVNISAERLFKLDVLEWLNNGEAKIFRSPGEGNYIVRLMNVSLSPEDRLGRMLHTFTCTAYEIAPFDYDELEYYGFISLDLKLNLIAKWGTIDLSKVNANTADSEYGGTVVDGTTTRYMLLKNTNNLIKGVSVTDTLPGTIFYIGGQSYVVGTTGAYKFTSEEELGSNIGIDATIADKGGYLGLLTYLYYTTEETNFSIIQSVLNEDVPCYQVWGLSYLNLLTNINSMNVLDYLNDAKRTISDIPYFKLIPREVKNIYWHYETDGFDPNAAPTINGYYAWSGDTYVRKTSEDVNAEWSDLSDAIDRTSNTFDNVYRLDVDYLYIYKIYRTKTVDTYITVNGEQYYVDRDGRYTEKLLLISGGTLPDTEDIVLTDQPGTYYEVAKTGVCTITTPKGKETFNCEEGDYLVCTSQNYYADEEHYALIKAVDFEGYSGVYYAKRQFKPYTGYYYDPIINKIILESGENVTLNDGTTSTSYPTLGVFEASINGEVIRLDDMMYRLYEDFDVTDLQIGVGILLEIGFRESSTTYTLDVEEGIGTGNLVYTTYLKYLDEKNTYFTNRTTEYPYDAGYVGAAKGTLKYAKYAEKMRLKEYYNMVMAYRDYEYALRTRLAELDEKRGS